MTQHMPGTPRAMVLREYHGGNAMRRSGKHPTCGRVQGGAEHDGAKLDDVRRALTWNKRSMRPGSTAVAARTAVRLAGGISPPSTNKRAGSSLDRTQIRYFLALASTRNFTRARSSARDAVRPFARCPEARGGVGRPLVLRERAMRSSRSSAAPCCRCCSRPMTRQSRCASGRDHRSGAGPPRCVWIGAEVNGPTDALLVKSRAGSRGRRDAAAAGGGSADRGSDGGAVGHRRTAARHPLPERLSCWRLWAERWCCWRGRRIARASNAASARGAGSLRCWYPPPRHHEAAGRAARRQPERRGRLEEAGMLVRLGLASRSCRKLAETCWNGRVRLAERRPLLLAVGSARGAR
jgi:hypothetical protein